jgi:hypothetical protein
MTVEFDIQAKLAVYKHFTETGRRPSTGDVAGRVGSEVGEDRPTLDARDNVVFDSAAGRFSASSAGRNAPDFRRPGRRLLGSKIG